MTLAAVLADATNLGHRRMAEACALVSQRQLAWLAAWHLREAEGLDYTSVTERGRTVQEARKARRVFAVLRRSCASGSRRYGTRGKIGCERSNGH